MMNNNDIVIITWWDGQPVWRYKTAEEKLSEGKIEKEVANLYIALSEK